MPRRELVGWRHIAEPGLPDPLEVFRTQPLSVDRDEVRDCPDALEHIFGPPSSTGPQSQIGRRHRARRGRRDRAP